MDEILFIEYATAPVPYYCKKNKEVKQRKDAVAITSDMDDVRLLACYRPELFDYIQTGKWIEVKGMLVEETEFVLAEPAQVSAYSGDVMPLGGTQERAAELRKELEGPEVTGMLSVKEIKSLEHGHQFNTTIRVKQISPEPAFVDSLGVYVREGIGVDIKDPNEYIPFALWRHLAEYPLNSGDTIVIQKGIRAHVNVEPHRVEIPNIPTPSDDPKIATIRCTRIEKLQ